MDIVEKKRGVKPGSTRGPYRKRSKRAPKSGTLYQMDREVVEAIWKLLQGGNYTQKEIASMFGVTQEAVSHINTGTRWNSVTGLPPRKETSTNPPPSGAKVGRPRKNYLKSLKKRPLKDQYEKMKDLCLIALLNNIDSIKVILPSTFKRPKDFPNSVGRENLGNRRYLYTLRPDKLLDWMNKNGHSEYSSKDVAEVLRQIRLQVTLATKEIGLEIFKETLDIW